MSAEIVHDYLCVRNPLAAGSARKSLSGLGRAIPMASGLLSRGLQPLAFSC